MEERFNEITQAEKFHLPRNVLNNKLRLLISGISVSETVIRKKEVGRTFVRKCWRMNFMENHGSGSILEHCVLQG